MRNVFKILWTAFLEALNTKPPKIAATLILLLAVVTSMNGCGLPENFLGDLSRPGALSLSSAGDTGFDGKAFVHFSACPDGSKVSDRILYSNDGLRVKYIRKDCGRADLTIMASELQSYEVGELSYRTHRGKSFEEESRQAVRSNVRDADTILRCHYSDSQRDGELVILRDGRGLLSGRGEQGQIEQGEAYHMMTLDNAGAVRRYEVNSIPVGFQFEAPNPLPSYQAFLSRGEVDGPQGRAPVDLNCYASE